MRKLSSDPLAEAAFFTEGSAAESAVGLTAVRCVARRGSCAMPTLPRSAQTAAACAAAHPLDLLASAPALTAPRPPAPHRRILSLPKAAWDLLVTQFPQQARLVLLNLQVCGAAARAAVVERP